MRIVEENNLIKLYADEGMILFNDEGIESEEVILGKYDKPENWHEKPKEEQPEEIVEE